MCQAMQRSTYMGVVRMKSDNPMTKAMIKNMLERNMLQHLNFPQVPTWGALRGGLAHLEYKMQKEPLLKNPKERLLKHAQLGLEFSLKNLRKAKAHNEATKNQKKRSHHVCISCPPLFQKLQHSIQQL
jgi:hypothetical protein